MRTLFSLVIVCVIASGLVFFFVSQQQHSVVQTNEAPQLSQDTTETQNTKSGKRKKGKRKSGSNQATADETIIFVAGAIDSLAIHKGDRDLFAFKDGQLVKQYKVALGLSPVGPKVFEGDNKTPEGWYYINRKNPISRYHKSLGVSYPNETDKANAAALGKKPGGDIMIHGLMKFMFNKGKNHIKSDWTFGCIAVTDEEIDELFESVNVGTPVVISP